MKNFLTCLLTLIICSLICLLTHIIGYAMVHNAFLDYNKISFIGIIGTILWYLLIYTVGIILWLEYCYNH
jgi:hypothetical protein